MPPRSGEPLAKITINIFAEDLIKLRKFYGHGWSNEVREMIHDKLRIHTPPSTTQTYTLEDLDD